MQVVENAVENLVSLVGGNPLPLYLVAATLKPRNLWLVYTSQTKTTADSIRMQIRENFPEIQCHVEPRHCIKDSHDAGEVHSVINHIQPGAWLDYTGGTKVMDVHGYETWKEQSRNSLARALYLEEGGGPLPTRIRFADGLQSVRVNIRLSLETLAGLHGYRDLDIRPYPKGSPTPDDAEKMLGHFLEDLDNYQGRRLKDINSGLNDRFNAVSKAFENNKVIRDQHRIPIDLVSFQLGLSIGQLPDPSWPPDRAASDLLLYRWLRFLVKQEWLEEWAANCARQVASGEDRVVSGITITPPNRRKFELDGVVIREHRLYVLSCTTSNSMNECKTKLFEAAHRAHQLGGDLARSALVCPLGIGEENGVRVNQAEEVEKDFHSVWEPPNKPRVFGQRELEDWCRGGMLSLEQWLES